MGRILLYHGTSEKVVVPTYGCGDSEYAYSRLSELKDDLLFVEYSEFNARYNHRDVTARKKMKDLVDSDANKVTRVFSTLFEG